MTGLGAMGIVIVLFVLPPFFLAGIFALASRFVRPERRSSARTSAIATILLSLLTRWVGMMINSAFGHAVSFTAWLAITLLLAGIIFVWVGFRR